MGFSVCENFDDMPFGVVNGFCRYVSSSFVLCYFGISNGDYIVSVILGDM